MFSLFHKGGPIMWPLLCASILGMTVVIERVLFVLKQKTNQRQLLRKKIILCAEAGDFDQAKAAGENCKDYVVNVLVQGIRHKESLQLALVTAASDHLKKASRGIVILDTIITLAPLLGLLGTVTGMISAFGLLGAQELDAPTAITGGIAEALIATGFGLGIAITCLIPFNWLNAYVENMKHEMEQAGSVLETIMSKKERGVYAINSNVR